MSIIEYPKWLHGMDGVSVLVEDIEAEIALDGPWFQSPAEAADAAESAKTDAPRRGRPPRAPADAPLAAKRPV